MSKRRNAEAREEACKEASEHATTEEQPADLARVSIKSQVS